MATKKSQVLIKSYSFKVSQRHSYDTVEVETSFVDSNFSDISIKWRGVELEFSTISGFKQFVAELSEIAKETYE